VGDNDPNLSTGGGASARGHEERGGVTRCKSHLVKGRGRSCPKRKVTATRLWRFEQTPRLVVEPTSSNGAGGRITTSEKVAHQGCDKPLWGERGEGNYRGDDAAIFSARPMGRFWGAGTRQIGGVIT